MLLRLKTVFFNQNSVSYMRSFILILTIFFCVVEGTYAQIKIKGQVIDLLTNEPIEYATITLMNARDSSFLDGTISNNFGDFSISYNEKNNVYISISFLGYYDYFSDIISSDSDIVLPKILMELRSEVISGIEISGNALTSSYKSDKQVFKANQFKSAQGGNASDVLRNLPSVTINSFGEISVRGSSGFLVLINGRAIQGDYSTILSQIPANTIEDIDLITSPSAKYDPDGTAGIINIKTKTAALSGSYLQVNSLIGIPSIQDYDNKKSASRYGIDAAYQVRKENWDFSLGADYRRYDISGRREGYVNTYLNGILTEFPSDGERSFDEKNYSANAFFNFYPSEKHHISTGFFIGKRTKDRTADILYTDQQRILVSPTNFSGTESYYNNYLATGQVSNGNLTAPRISFFNENLRVRKGDFTIGSLAYEYKMDASSSLKLDVLYERTVLGGPTDNVSLGWPNTSRVLQLQYNDNNNPLDGFRIKADYTKTINDTKLEAGYQYRYLDHPGDFEYFDRDLENDIWVENPLFTNSIRLTRSIHSFYNNLSGNIGKFTYNAGLRLEYFNRSVKIDRPDETFNLDQWNLFPSLLLNYALTESLSLKASYNRRIERTTTFKMTPFPEREHSETLEQGDAELLPEYIDVAELGIVKKWDDHSIAGTIYYRNTKNVINRVNTVFNDTILNRIYTNVGNGEVMGFEIGTNLYPSKKTRFYLGFNYYNYAIEGDLFGDNISTSSNIYSINSTLDFPIASQIKGQFAFNYLSDRITAQGTDSRFYNPSLSLTYAMNKNWNIGLQWLNMDMGLLSSNEQRITTIRDNFFTTTNYVYEVDIVQLTASFKINQPSKSNKAIEAEFGKKEF
jgi:outer membrane receptor protein involved in Fe transport